MVQPIIKTSNAENVLANSLERTGASVAHTAYNIATGTAHEYNNDYGYDWNDIPVHSNYNNNTASGNLDMANEDDMNLTTNVLQLATSATAYKATAQALKSVNDTENDVIRQLIGTNEG